MFSFTYSWSIDQILDLTVPQIRLYLWNLYNRSMSGIGLAMTPLGGLIQGFTGGNRDEAEPQDQVEVDATQQDIQAMFKRG